MNKGGIMKTIKIIDLLNKIANGEEVPKKIKVTGRIYEFDDELNFYYTKKDYMGIALGGVSDEINLIANAFNDIVEILDEEDEFEDIEKIDYKIFKSNISNRKIIDIHSQELAKIKYKINQLIKNQKKIISQLNKE